MASLALKTPENIDGAFFVDQSCIDCDLCRQTAPKFFKRHHVGNQGYSFVAAQPANQKEMNLCMEALRACPVEAIGQISEQERSTYGKDDFYETADTETRDFTPACGASFK